MSLFTEITFDQICLTLVTLAVAERAIMPLLPETLVGPKGWLLKTSD
jgi:hypothetical protein